MSLIPEQLAAIAERLRLHSIVMDGEKRRIAYDADNAKASLHVWRVLSDGDLLLAMLNRAVQMGGYIELCGQDEHWTARNSVIRMAHGPCREPLEAVALAFIQLPVQP